jgi:hypothetical protein
MIQCLGDSVWRALDARRHVHATDGLSADGLVPPLGFAAIPGSETGLGGYRQLGCGSVEAGPFACCVPTFDCGGTECPVLSVCVGRSGPAPEVFACEPRPTACEGAMDCTPPCTMEMDCIAAACGTFLDSASISGNTIRCPGA